MINVDGGNGRVVGWKWQRCLVAVLVVCSMMAAFLAHPRAVSAATQYYVSTGGSDSNPGTSDRPWRTIQKAANTMVAGDTVTVRAGDYPERVQVSRSGSSGAQITYQAEGTVTMKGFTVRGNYVTVRGFDISNTPNAWADGQGIFVQANYCIIENNYVHFATRGGIFVYAEPWEWSSRTGSVVRNNRLYKNALVGIEVHGRNHVVEGNNIWGTIQHHPNWPSPSYSDADGIRFFGAGHVFRRNYIHDINFSDPENVNPHIDCFQTWGAEYQEAGRDIVFERNWCEVLESQTAYESGTAFMLAGSSGLVIRSNVLQAAKIVNTGGGGNSNLRIANNTMTSDLSFPTTNYPQGVALENCPSSTVRNNILYNMPGEVYKVTGTSTQGLAMGNNLVYRSDGKALVGSPYPGDLWGVSPGFVNAGGGDYHLQATSAAVNKGYNVGTLVPVDYDGLARPQGGAFDIGAFETGAQAPTSTPVRPTSTPVRPTNTPVRPTSTPVRPTSTPVPSVQEVIVDDAGNAFGVVSGQDAWQTYNQAGGQHYGGSHRYNPQRGSGQDVATFYFAVPRSGRYAVYGWWWAGEWRPADVPYVIQHLNGVSTVKVNQRINGGKWNLLGTYRFVSGGTVKVTDGATSGQDIVADAIRLVYVGP